MKYKEHPIAAIFPMMSDEQYQAFKSDVAEHGLKSSGLLYQGKILDGRNRHRACQELGIQMEWQEVELSEDVEFDPIAYVISHNLHRRHLTEPQRSIVAAKIATMKPGDAKSQRDDAQICASQAEAANLLSVSRRSVQTARQILDSGSKELVQAVEQDKVSLNQAASIIKSVPDKAEQSKLVSQGKDAIKAATAKPKQKPNSNAKPKEVPASQAPEDSDDYDYPFVKAFEQCDYRLNTLKMVIDLLSPTEREILKEWLA